MIIGEALKTHLDSLNVKPIVGSDFTVEIFYPEAVRYKKESRSITMSAELISLDRLESKQRSVLWNILFRKTCLGVYIEHPLGWDNEGLSIPDGKVSEIVDAVQWALSQRVKRWRIFRGNFENESRVIARNLEKEQR